MMGAFYSGVSGIKAQTTALNVISNNIANVNTTGFKSQRVSFSDLLSQTLSGATAPTEKRAGMNPMQIGLGTNVSNIVTDMTPGSPSYTGKPSDMAINGDGYFIVKGGSKGEYQFTREGDFYIDNEGSLAVNGYKVCGWNSYTVDANGNYIYNTNSKVEPINLYTGPDGSDRKYMPASATTSSKCSGVFDSSATQKTGTTTVRDSLGNSHDVTITWTKVDADGTGSTWKYSLSFNSADITSVSPSTGSIRFDSSGAIVTTDTSKPTSISVTWTPNASLGTGTFTETLSFTGLSVGNATESENPTITSDGEQGGSLTNISFGEDGVIMGKYSNGKSRPLGMLALATFANQQGLEKLGDNLYGTSASSGEFTGGVPAGSSGVGSLSSSSLEASNVDLSNELSQMMIVQRAYSANTKSVSAADEMLQTLLAMKN